MDTFHTDYDPPENATDIEFCHSGITFKKHMIEHFTKLKAMTICFRINMDYFASLFEGYLYDGCDDCYVRHCCNAMQDPASVLCVGPVGWTGTADMTWPRLLQHQTPVPLSLVPDAQVKRKHR